MHLATDTSSLEGIRKRIMERFAEFNQHSVASTGRQYPDELRELIFQGHQAGLQVRELMGLSGMSSTAVNYATKRLYRREIPLCNKKKSSTLAPRRLEVAIETVEPPAVRSSILVRLASGVVLELLDGSALTPSLLYALATLEVNHVATR